MTLVELLTEANTRTGLPMPEIAALIRVNWPGHFQYTPTQAALLVDLINRKKENSHAND